MPDYGSTDRVRRSAAQKYVEPARRRGDKLVRIHSGEFGKALLQDRLLASGRYQIICDALRSKKFQQQNGLTLIEIQAPDTARSGSSSTVTFVFSLDGDASPFAAAAPDRISLFDQLRGVSRDAYKHLGGAEAFHRKERESWES